jgi:hypothetical protein
MKGKTENSHQKGKGKSPAGEQASLSRTRSQNARLDMDQVLDQQASTMPNQVYDSDSFKNNLISHLLNNKSSVADSAKNIQKHFDSFLGSFNQQIMEDRNLGLGPQVQRLNSIVQQQ